MKNKISFEEMLKSLKENRKESDVASIDDRIESKKIDFKLKISLISTLAKFQTKSLYYLFKVLFSNCSEFFFFVF